MINVIQSMLRIELDCKLAARQLECGELAADESYIELIIHLSWYHQITSTSTLVSQLNSERARG